MTMFLSTSRAKLPITFPTLPGRAAEVDGPRVTFVQYSREVRRYSRLRPPKENREMGKAR